MLSYTLCVERERETLSLSESSPYTLFSEANFFCWLVFEVIILEEQGSVLMSTRSPLSAEESLTFLCKAPVASASYFAKVSIRNGRPGQKGRGDLN